MLSKYMNARDRRTESRTLSGTMRGGKLTPVMAVPFRESEAGMINQRVMIELKKISGTLVTKPRLHVVSVFVPALACDALKNDTDQYAGNAEIYREKLLSGAPVFDLEVEGEISKRLGLVPRSIGGEKKVNEIGRLAHNSAVNYLRRRKYVLADQIDKDSDEVTPALLGETVLDKLNGVLDPEDRVNGAVSLSGTIPVKGIGSLSSPTSQTGTFRETGGGTFTGKVTDANNNITQQVRLELTDDDFPNIRAVLDGANQNLSLDQFFAAQTMDSITRQLRKIVDDNPELGEEIVARWAFGLSADVGKQPFVLYERELEVPTAVERPMDGAEMDNLRTYGMGGVEWTVPVPRTEFGGIVITFIALKPDEALATQPHPILSDVWAGWNHVRDEMAAATGEPVPVYVRDLDADCDTGDENTLALYTGLNHLQKRYVHYGFHRGLDTTTVENKSAIWQYSIPMSVTPQSVIYPEYLDHYPFADHGTEQDPKDVGYYTIAAQVAVNTPRIFGPTPVEELAAIEDEEIFEDAEE